MSTAQELELTLPRRLRQLALALDQVVETIACQGTALEAASFKVGTKAFLFIGKKDARLKLQASLPTAHALMAQSGSVKVGAMNWVTLVFDETLTLETEVLKTWVEESYQLMAPTRLRKSPGAGKGSV